MSLLFRGGPRRSEERAVTLPSWLFQRDGRGVSVDGDTARRHDAVWSCVTAIAQDVSMMPVDVVRYVGGARQPVEPVPQIVAAPSAFLSAIDWRYQLVDSWLTAGNAWGQVTATSGGGVYPTRIELLSPADVRVWMDGTKVRYMVNNEEHDLWPLGDLWHVPAYTVAGSVLGLSPIAYHRVTIGHGLNAQQFSSDFFADGGHPTALLQPEGALTEDQARSLKQRFVDMTRGNREPVVLASSTKYTPLQVAPDDSQFLEAMSYSALQVCRIFREDPADHGVAVSGGDSITYANRVDVDLARFKRRQFWVVKMQDALSACLPPPQQVRLNVSASLMMTDKERHELHALRLASRTRTVNEVRRIEDEAPFGAEFDEPGIPGGDDEVTRQAVILQKMYLAVGVVLTADEAREMARKAGIALPTAYDPALLGKTPTSDGGGA